METAGRQSAALADLSQFLLEHEACGHGFDVSHPAGLGSGRLTLACRGCGGSYEYATATIEFEREIEFAQSTQWEKEAGLGPVALLAAPVPPVVEPTPPPLEPGPPPQGRPPQPPRRPPKQPQRGTQRRGRGQRPSSRRGNRGKRDRIIVGGLLIVGIAALAFAAIRLSGDSEESSLPASTESPRTAPSQPGGTGPPAQQTQSESSPSAQPGGSSAASSEPGSKSTDSQGSGSTNAAGSQPGEADKAGSANSANSPAGNPGGVQPPTPASGQQGSANEDKTGDGKSTARVQAGERLVKTSRFSLVVPAGWTKQTTDVGLLLAPSSTAPASVWVFFEKNPGMNRSTMASKTAGFLRARAPGGKVGDPKWLKVGGHPAFELHDRGRSGSQAALGVLAGPYRYLAIESVETAAPKSVRAAASHALHSFRTR